MLFTTPATFLLLLGPSVFALASTGSVTPVASIGLDLVLRSSGNGTATGSAAQGSFISAILCGIGILSSCPAQKSINTKTDLSNCGELGNICPSSYEHSTGNVTCKAGKCRSSCEKGYAFSSTAGGCISTSNDPRNCGKLGHVCSIPHANPTCIAGVCTIFSCARNFHLVNGTCNALNYSKDPLNCGGEGIVCTLGIGYSGVECDSGSCRPTGCTIGFIKTADGASCEALNIMTNPSNCGAVGRECPTVYSFGIGATICLAGICQPTACLTGYAFDTSISACRPILGDVNNCGAVGHVCVVKGGFPSCLAGICGILSCVTPYRLVSGMCTTSASARARNKKAKVPKPLKLCPGTETACPIVGSASFAQAQSSGFAAFRAPNKRALAAMGGYECLDTDYAIESCGGCTAMNEGVNCLLAPHSSGVGCSAGKCVVFSCDAGYRPNFDSTGCVKVHASARAKRAHANAAKKGVQHRH